MPRQIGHWTPRYVIDRTKLYINEKLHPGQPWLTKEAVSILDRLLKKNDFAVEFGSGRSTVWFAARVGRLISIESDKNWFDKVNSLLTKKGIKNVDYRLHDESSYLDVIGELEDESVDFSLVDGERRDECANKILPKIKKGGILAVDNINWFLPSKTLSPSSMREGRHRTELWKDFAKNTKAYRQLWTSNGITDTLIIFKS